MRPDQVIPDPRSLPDNANLPTINQPATIIGVTVAILSTAVVAIGLRLWVRIRGGLWGRDDAFVLLAGISSIVGDVVVCLMPDDGLGLHLWTLDSQHLIKYFKHVYTTNVSYCSSATFIKLSILFQYLRLFAESSSSTSTSQYRLSRRLTWSLIILCSAWGFTFFLLAIFACSPIAKNWNPHLHGKCIGWGSKDPNKFFAMFVGHAASNMMLDVMVLALPLPFLAMLRLAGKNKLGLIGLFSLGCIVGALAIGRMIALSLDRAGTIPVMDMSFHTPSVYIFGVLEVNVAIIAASVPIFWPIITGLATNKIFVVNEVDVHVEEASRNSSFASSRAIDLVDQPSPPSWLDDDSDPFGGHASRLSVLERTYDPSASRSSHIQKKSNASSLGKTLGLDFGRRRSSEDSHRCLHRAPSREESSSKGSLTRSESIDYFLEMDKELAGGRTTTTVERTEIPFDHIKAFDERQKS